MRTNIVIDEKLMKETLRLTGLKNQAGGGRVGAAHDRSPTQTARNPPVSRQASVAG